MMRPLFLLAENRNTSDGNTAKNLASRGGPPRLQAERLGGRNEIKPVRHLWIAFRTSYLVVVACLSGSIVHLRALALKFISLLITGLSYPVRVSVRAKFQRFLNYFLVIARRLNCYCARQAVVCVSSMSAPWPVHRSVMHRKVFERPRVVSVVNRWYLFFL